MWNHVYGKVASTNSIDVLWFVVLHALVYHATNDVTSSSGVVTVAQAFVEKRARMKHIAKNVEVIVMTLSI